MSRDSLTCHELAKALADMVAYELVLAGRGSNTLTDRQYHHINVEVWMQAQELAKNLDPNRMLEMAEAEAKRHWFPAPTSWSDAAGLSYFRARAWQRVVHAGWKSRPDVAPRWPMPDC